MGFTVVILSQKARHKRNPYFMIQFMYNSDPDEVSQVAQLVKNLLVNARDTRDTGLIPASRRSPGVGNGNPPQYSWPRKFRRQRSLEGAQSMGLQRVGHDWACTGQLAEPDEAELWCENAGSQQGGVYMCDFRPNSKRESGLSVMLCFLVQVPVKTVIPLCENSSHDVLKI